MVAQRVYTIIGRKAETKLPDNHVILYWKRSAMAWTKLNQLMALKKKEKMAKKIISEIKGSIKKCRDPLEFVKHIEGLMGDNIDAPTEWSSETEKEKKKFAKLINELASKPKQHKKKSQNNNHGFFYNPKIPKAGCSFCANKNCKNVCHLQSLAFKL